MRVRYRGDAIDAQVQWGECEDPRGVLVPGATYTVADREVHSQHTKLFLEGVPSGRGFNSVHFDRVRGRSSPAA